MKKRFAALLTLTLSLPSWANESFDRLLDDIWQYSLTTNPASATRHGLEGYADKLADYSPQTLAQQNQQYLKFRQRLLDISPEQLTAEQKITYTIQLRELDNQIDEYRFNSHFVPLTSEYGFHSSLTFLPSSTRINSLKDAQNYLAKLSQIPRYIDQHIAWMKKGIEVGMTQPKAVLAGYEQSIQAFITEQASESVFYQPFTQMQSLTQAQQQNVLKQAREVINQQVVPAYQRYLRFFTEQYQPAAKDDIAAANWPDGRAYYQNRIKHYTTTDLTAEEIHGIGLAEVKRIRGEMQTVIDELEFEGDLAEFIHFLRTDPQFYASSSEQLMQYAAYLSKRIDALLPKLFYTLPRTPYGVAPVPDSIAPKYTTGRYISPNRDDQPGYYWVNTYALDKRPLYALPALTLHEAVPGHHLQISLASEMQGLPPVRRYSYISAFGEGWGLYSEFLGKEVGFYQTPYDEFGRLSYEMWRACRLVVDTGMHMMGWSRQQALDYMLENTALSEHNVRTEIDRYISWPAQALSYKMGEIKIKELRRKAEQALGDKFDLRAFHDAVLAHGSIPLDELSRQIDDFIQRNK